MLFRLNLNPIVPFDMTVSVLVLISLIITVIAPKTKRIYHLRFIQLSLLGISLYYFFEALTYLLLSGILAIISGILLFPTTVFILIGVNYIMREKINPITLVGICCFGVIFCFSAFFPEAVAVDIVDRFTIIRLTGWFRVITEIFHILYIGIIGYWGIISWVNAPFLIKKEANLFLIATSFMVARVIINLLVYINPFWIIAVQIMFATGVIMLTFVITNEPKILFIFPFTINRILVRDKNGYPLFDHDWAKSKISEQVFTGFLNAIQLMSEEVVHLGGLLDIDLKEGILMIHESNYVSVGLVSSKSSKFLRNSLSHFIEDFEEMFEHNLKQGLTDPKVYEAAYMLIDKYFANFPIRLIEDENETILLEAKYLEIPKQLEQKLENMTISQEELNVLKSELLKAPKGFSSDFFSLYEKLTQEDDKESDHIDE
ncbi:MAG: hypothetical protein ACFE96_01125 [Candidatus Hermodarchaeota archaeon]